MKINTAYDKAGQSMITIKNIKQASWYNYGQQMFEKGINRDIILLLDYGNLYYFRYVISTLLNDLSSIRKIPLPL